MTYHKLRIFSGLVCGLLLLTACEDSGPNGYPDHITINPEGTSIVVVGTARIGRIHLQDAEFLPSYLQDDETKVVNDTLFCQYRWLTAILPLGEKKILISATPNDTGKKRKMWIECMMGPDFHEIFVTQLAK